MMRAAIERRLLQGTIGLAGCVPVLAGLAGVVTGTGFLGGGGEVSVESHARYLSGLLLGIGVAFWAAAPRIEAHGRRVRLLAGIVVVGGLARLLGVVADGPADAAMTGALAMELGVTPAIALWQGRVARLWGPTAARRLTSRRGPAPSSPTETPARSARPPAPPP